MEYRHESVLLDESGTYLDTQPGDIVFDGTAGGGGHLNSFAERVGSAGTLVGVDRDPSALQATRERLKNFSGRLELVEDNYRNISEIAEQLGISGFDRIFLDLGISSIHVDRPERGFSVQEDGPLDMRFGESQSVNAADIVNSYSEEELVVLFRNYGQERLARPIAQAIIRQRKQQLITRTNQLADLVAQVYHKKFSSRSRTHPATRVFQAIRIAVNDELESLEVFIPAAFGLLNHNGRIVILTYHSLEDRIVKVLFREKARADESFTLLTKKPISPTDDEIQRNPRSRSAKLRAIAKK